MQRKQSFVIKGMNRDMSTSKISSEYAYEIKNMRIFPTTENTLMNMVNEKGNKLLEFYEWDEKEEERIGDIQTNLGGIPLGQAVINNILVLFLTGISTTSPDAIDKFWFDKDGELLRIRLYNGDLNFKETSPIETLVYFENDDLQKVYWTDGINQPRMINIAASKETRDKWVNTSFDFVRTLKLQETVSIYKNEMTGGLFAPGAIQYIFTYLDQYGQETNPFYISTLLYTSFLDRGGSPEESVSNSFNIEIHNIQTDPSFDYVRIYSILRTSIDGTPECKRVVDIAPTQEEGDTYIIFTDTGTTGESIDPTELLYVGGEDITVGTMAQKDNTLFLGDITLNRKRLSSEIKDAFKGIHIGISSEEPEKRLEFAEPKGYYAYEHQLKYTAENIKTFKYLETYRLGLIFQHETGAWSDVLWVGDIKNNIPIKDTFYSYSTPTLTCFALDLDLKERSQDYEAIRMLLEAGYVKAKPVVVYPDINDRSCICQGVLCPTMYNLSDRYSNTPFVQSSWFTRINIPFDYDENYHLTIDTIGENEAKGDGRDKPNDDAIWEALDGHEEESAYSPAGILLNGYYKNTPNLSVIDVVNMGTWAECRHNYPIPNCINRRAEIQCITDPPAPEDLIQDNDTSDVDINIWVKSHQENYYIDQSIVTMHSPEIEFDDQVQSLDTNNIKLRIVGMVPITATAADIDIQTSTPANQYHEDYSDGPDWAKQTDIIWSIDHAPGFYKENVGAENSFYDNFSSPVIMGTSHFGWKGLVSGVYWLDEVSHSSRQNKSHNTTSFVVYPWHRNGSLNNCPGADESGYRESMLETKKISNLRFSYKTQYFNEDDIWEAYKEQTEEEKEGNSEWLNTGISGVRIFNSDEITLVKIPAPEHSNLSDLNYYGNNDKLLTIELSKENDEKTKDTPRGYPIVVTGRGELEVDNNEDDESNTFHQMFRNKYCTIYKIDGEGCEKGTAKHYLHKEYCYGTDPVRIKYKSTPHAVMALNYTSNQRQRILPNIAGINKSETERSTTQHFYWDKNSSAYGISQDTINDNIIPHEIEDVTGPQYGWLWLGELYRDDKSISNRFGGDSEEALEQNIWQACGESVPLTLSTDKITIKWTEGDTYYQRYDHIKTYPFTLEDQNSVIDIVSFMCETRINLDGRYDKNRGQLSNLAITPENFNQVNKAYSQENNFFTYNTINPNRINLDDFHNTITWTKTKIPGDIVDTWTNITVTSTLDLDGDKGDLNALRKYGNELLAFQDTGISQIKYNENVQLAVTEGVPVELANSGKVDGKNYLTNQIGCTNKWSIQETANGLYFIDDITKAIYLFNGQFTNITDNFGFSSWIANELKEINLWTPTDFKNFVTYYDKINNDVMFINKNSCLALSEPLGTFSSFYDYEDTPYMINIQNKLLSIRDNGDSTFSMWLQHEGEYNSFFGKNKPFWTTIIANDGMVIDKTFDNLEFRADTFDENNNYQCDETFDHLQAWNSHQESLDTILTFAHNQVTNLKKKFNIFRANIPRDNIRKRDRIRNPWAYLKLSKQSEDNHKTILHDMQVIYFDNTPIGIQTQEEKNK